MLSGTWARCFSPVLWATELEHLLWQFLQISTLWSAQGQNSQREEQRPLPTDGAGVKQQFIFKTRVGLRCSFCFVFFLFILVKIKIPLLHHVSTMLELAFKNSLNYQTQKFTETLETWRRLKSILSSERHQAYWLIIKMGGINHWFVNTSSDAWSLHTVSDILSSQTVVKRADVVNMDVW